MYSVDEEENPGLKIGEILATDQDIGKNAELTYTIVSGADFNGRKM